MFEFMLRELLEQQNNGTSNVNKTMVLLMSTFPIELLKPRSPGENTIDKIITVCSVLDNLCPTVVPFN